MIVELALATHIPPAQWAGEDDVTLATALTVLDEQARRRG